MDGQTDSGQERQVVNINTASLEELRDVVEGIGQVLAERIVAHREANGAFGSVDDLVQVAGIGPGSLAGYADQLTVSEVTDLVQAPEAAIVGPVGEVRRERAPRPARTVDLPPVIELPEVSGAAEDLDDDDEDDVPEITAYLNDDDLGEELDLDRDEAELSLGDPVEPVAAADSLDDVSDDDGEEEAVTDSSDESDATPAAAAEETLAPKRRRWHDLLMVLLGGLLGVVLTLVIAILASGTLDFAPRRQVDALSRNVNTMQTNQELAWERLDEVTLKASELERRLTRVEPLVDKVDELGTALGEAEEELGALRTDVAQAQADVAALEEALTEEVAALDGRITRTEDGLVALDGALGELETAFGAVEERVERFDAFFAALRDLLIDLEGEAPEPADESAG